MFFFSYFYIYLSLFFFICMSLLLGFILLSLSFIVSFRPFSSNVELGTPYECGFLPFRDSRMKFDVQFYLIAILFVIFDIEVCLLLPWVVSLFYINYIGFFSLIIFFIFLGFGFLFEWNMGALDLIF